MGDTLFPPVDGCDGFLEQVWDASDLVGIATNATSCFDLRLFDRHERTWRYQIALGMQDAPVCRPWEMCILGESQPNNRRWVS